MFFRSQLYTSNRRDTKFLPDERFDHCDKYPDLRPVIPVRHTLLEISHASPPLGRNSSHHIKMGSIMSSLQLVAIVSTAIFAIVMLTLGIWRVCGFVGYPVGNWLVRRLPCYNTNSEEDRCKTARVTVALLGMWMSWAFMQWHVMYPVGFPHERGHTPHQWYILIGIWVVGTALQGCFEAVMVLAILSGVVKISERGSERVPPASIPRAGERRRSVDAEKESEYAV